MSKIWRVEEEQIMKAGKIIKINYIVWYKDENDIRTARREYRHEHYKVIPMTVLNFILDENNEATTKYQEFDGCIYKRTMYQEEKKMENINMTTAQEDIEDAIKFGWIEAQETTTTENTESEKINDSMDWEYVEKELWNRHERMSKEKQEEQTMKYDNCKNCGNIHCEHYGKDREFVCPKGISCKTEKIKNTKTYIIKCTQFHVDDNFNLIGNPIIREFSGSSWKEAKAAWRMAKDNNDMTKFSALDVCDIIITEEE